MSSSAPIYDSPGQFVEKLAAIVGAANLITHPADLAPYLADWRGAYRGDALAVVRPAKASEVAAVVEACAAAGVAIVPQGGNTSLCGASVPLAQGPTCIVLSLGRINRVRAIDPDNHTITVEAGCTLAGVQRAAAEHDRLFPLSLASEGSCQIGGNLSTNAGGVHVLRYGNMRELVLGIEAVLPDGRIWGGLRGLRKDNTGYDIKQLLIGAEGTLGVITAAVLKLFPRPRARLVGWAALSDPAAAVALLSLLRARTGTRLNAFEMVSRICVDLVLRHMPDTRDPLPQAYPCYALIELADSSGEAELSATLEAALAAAVERGLVLDAVVAQSETQAMALWALRENISDAQRIEGVSIKHDISVPTSRIAEFVAATGDTLARQFSDIRIVAFGHVGDGNIHYNCSMADADANRRLLAARHDVNRIVYASVDQFGGSISAEHGIGQLKRDILADYKSPVEIELMRAVKRALDPHGIMNPGKVLP